MHSTVRIGPYALRLAVLPREKMPDRRQYAVTSIEHGVLAVREDVVGLPRAKAFLRALIRYIHYTRGCQQGCTEEAYTQSFATGFVEFARRNLDVWRWFNELLGEGLAVAAVQTGAPEPPMPKRFLIGGQAVRLRLINAKEAGGAFGWFDYEQHEAQLWDGMRGATRAVVAVHELTHGVHAAAELDDGCSHKAFVEGQTKGWLDFMTTNPTAWRWLVHVLTTRE